MRTIIGGGGRKQCEFGGKTWSVPYYCYYYAVNQADMQGSMHGGVQSLITEMQTVLNLQQGEINMLFMDMPDVPPQYAPVVIAQAEQAQPQLVAGSAKAERTIGVCQLIQGADMPPSAFNAISPTTSAWIYLRKQENLAKEVTDQALVNAKTTLIKGATHGTLKYIATEQGEAYYRYYPDSGYAGADQATFLVEMGNYKVTLIYHFKVGGEFGATDGYNSYDDKRNCPNGRRWKISTTQDVNGSLVVNSVDYLPTAPSTSDTLTSSTLNDWFTLAQLDSKFADMSNVTVTVADLPGGAIGQTVGTNITLDTNAANYNWFIDTTPWDNSEYLPTSNPYEWVAKAGTAAYGKMDMLSVLLHEYGHALGIDHSADNHDYMATTLTPGVRRMPSAEEMALMQQLVAQAKDGLASNNTQDNTPTPFPTLPFGTTLSLAV